MIQDCRKNRSDLSEERTSGVIKLHSPGHVLNYRVSVRIQADMSNSLRQAEDSEPPCVRNFPEPRSEGPAPGVLHVGPAARGDNAALPLRPRASDAP